MNSIDTSLSGQISRTRQYERSSQVRVDKSVMREQGAETEVSRKTTTEKIIETTRTRRQLESKIRQLNNELNKLGRNEVQFEITSVADQTAVKLVDNQNSSKIDLTGKVASVLSTDSADRNGLLVNTIA